MTTAIPWTDHTINPGVYGCWKISPGCRHCYAARMARRQVAMGNYPAEVVDRNGWTGKVVVDYDRIKPAFAKLPKKKPARVFVLSMADLWHVQVPWVFVNQVFRQMRDRPHLTFQVLTKRAALMAAWWKDGQWRGPWPDNVWAGVTVEDQEHTSRVRHLLTVPAPVRFVSCEPLLSDLVFGFFGNPNPGIHWVVAGCESGPNRRPTDEQWFRNLRDRCQREHLRGRHPDAKPIPFFLKQGERGGRVQEMPELDGRTWAQFPEVP